MLRIVIGIVRVRGIGVIELSIDASTSKCGIAVFDGGDLMQVRTEEFEGTWCPDKLNKIIDTFEDILSYYSPDTVLIEEPLVFAKQSRSVAMLNQVGGAIYTVARMYKMNVYFFHGQKVKKILGFKTKEESIKLASNHTGIKDINEHEADAVNLYLAYLLRDEENKVKPDRENRKKKSECKQRD